MADCEFALRFTGSLASQRNAIQLYDVAHALVGFERTIALTTHLLLNGEVRTQSPSTRGFQLYTVPFQEGSFQSKALLYLGGTAASAVIAAGVAPPDSAFGWLAKSAVEYVVEESLGFTPDFDETLGPQIREFRKLDRNTVLPSDLSQGRFDSVIEKVESGLKAIHRPIIKSQSAQTAQIDYRVSGSEGTIGGYFSIDSFEYIDQTVTSEDFSEYVGSISSYNTNTFKGRIFVSGEHRTVPFELSEDVRHVRTINRITKSLSDNGRRRASGILDAVPDIGFNALRNESSNGRLKSLYVTQVRSFE